MMVKPVKLELSAQAGHSVQHSIEIRNTAAETKTFDVKLVEILQSGDGGWMVLEPGLPGSPSPYSCHAWVSLSAQSVTVEPLQTASCTITAQVPPRARGFCFAGMLVQSRPRPEDKGVAIVIRFLVPILIDVQGAPERQIIQLKDTDLVYRAPGPKLLAANFANLHVVNDGRTYGRIKGSVKIQYLAGTHWRQVLVAETREQGILPGSDLLLNIDLNRSLPAGQYKLIASLSIDGRLLRPLTKEVLYAGDPGSKALAVDTALTLDPPALNLNGLPGATRTAVLKVENTSDDAITIDAQTLLPPALKGVAQGGVSGESLSCAPWVEITPARFELRPHARQSIRVVARLPETGATAGNYYGLIVLDAAHADGQRAGQTTAMVNVRNDGIAAHPAAQGTRMTLAATTDAHYAVQARFANSGNVHVTPKCSAVLLTSLGQSIASIALEGDETSMLPLQTREFSGVIDLSVVPPGTYALKTVLEDMPVAVTAPLKRATARAAKSGVPSALGGQQLAIEVKSANGANVVTVLSREAIEIGQLSDTNSTAIPGVK